MKVRIEYIDVLLENAELNYMLLVAGENIQGNYYN
jgi:hypothetical protein